MLCLIKEGGHVNILISQFETKRSRESQHVLCERGRRYEDQNEFREDECEDTSGRGIKESEEEVNERNDKNPGKTDDGQK